MADGLDDRCRTLVSFAEEGGFGGVWVMEHHFATAQLHPGAADMMLGNRFAAYSAGK